MPNPFGNLKKDGLEESQDTLGGYSVFESDIYPNAVLKMFYAGISPGGAKSCNIELDIGGKSHRETLYVTNKAGLNRYEIVDKKTGKGTGKFKAIPGFETIDDLCLILTGKDLGEQEFEEKVVNIYDYEAKKEVPKSVMVATELLGKTVAVGLKKVIENKTKKVGDEYVPTAETRTSNVVNKFFEPETKMTVAEARREMTEGSFWHAWLAKHQGVTDDKRTYDENASGQSGRPGAAKSANNAGPPQSASAGAAPKKSLFANRAAS